MSLTHIVVTCPFRSVAISCDSTTGILTKIAAFIGQAKKEAGMQSSQADTTRTLGAYSHSRYLAEVRSY